MDSGSSRRFGAMTLIPVMLGFAIAPFMGRVVESYEAIVISVKDDGLVKIIDEQGIQSEHEEPATRAVQPGELLVKRPFTWNADIVTDSEAAPDLKRWYADLTEVFEGVVLRLEYPPDPQGGMFFGGTMPVAVIGTTDGRKVEIDLRSGQRVRLADQVQKRSGEWAIRPWDGLSEADANALFDKMGGERPPPPKGN